MKVQRSFWNLIDIHFSAHAINTRRIDLTLVYRDYTKLYVKVFKTRVTAVYTGITSFGIVFLISIGHSQRIIILLVVGHVQNFSQAISNSSNKLGIVWLEKYIYIFTHRLSSLSSLHTDEIMQLPNACLLSKINCTKAAVQLLT